jgi:uncharacterized protein YcfJ
VNNTVLASLIVGAVVVSAAGAIAYNSGFNPLQKYATVVAVEPAFETHRVPRQVCGDEAAMEQAATSNAEDSGQTTAAGAAAGGDAGAKTEKPAPKKDDTDATADEPCVMVYDTESVPAGFDVTYELDGVQRVVRMDERPGERIPVDDGELVLKQS